MKAPLWLKMKYSLYVWLSRIEMWVWKSHRWNFLDHYWDLRNWTTNGNIARRRWV